MTQLFLLSFQSSTSDTPAGSRSHSPVAARPGTSTAPPVKQSSPRGREKEKDDDHKEGEDSDISVDSDDPDVQRVMEQKRLEREERERLERVKEEERKAAEKERQEKRRKSVEKKAMQKLAAEEGRRLSMHGSSPTLKTATKEAKTRKNVISSDDEEDEVFFNVRIFLF